jgi:hypothetical protein
MELTLVLQNQSLYLTTLHQRPNAWKNISGNIKKLIQETKTFLKQNNHEKPIVRIAIETALMTLEEEVDILEQIHAN